MNHCVLEVEVIEAPTVRYTQDNQTPIAEMAVRFDPLRADDPPGELKVVGWGNLAQDLQNRVQVGQRLVLEGRLRMNTSPDRTARRRNGRNSPSRVSTPSEVRQQARLQSRRPQAVSRLPPPSEPNSRTRKRRAGIPLPWCRTPTRSPSDLTDRRSPPAIHWRG